MAIWSGEYLHGGASYQVRNRRLFISITSKITVRKLKNVVVVSHQLITMNYLLNN